MKTIEALLSISGLLNFSSLFMIILPIFGFVKGGIIFLLLILIILPFQYKLWRTFISGSRYAYTAQLIVDSIVLILSIYVVYTATTNYPDSLALFIASWLALLGVGPGIFYWIIFIMLISTRAPFYVFILFPIIAAIYLIWTLIYVIEKNKTTHNR